MRLKPLGHPSKNRDTIAGRFRLAKKRAGNDASKTRCPRGRVARILRIGPSCKHAAARRATARVSPLIHERCAALEQDLAKRPSAVRQALQPWTASTGFHDMEMPRRRSMHRQLRTLVTSARSNPRLVPIVTLNNILEMRVAMSIRNSLTYQRFLQNQLYIS